jgi:hypothetical protein
MPFPLTFRTQDVPEPNPKGIPLGVLAPVKECALATTKGCPNLAKANLNVLLYVVIATIL